MGERATIWVVVKREKNGATYRKLPKQKRKMKDQQTSKPANRGTKEVAKARTKRKRRREEKKDPENAPKKTRYRGYT